MAIQKGRVPVGLVVLSIVLALVLVNAVVFGWKAFTMEEPGKVELTLDLSGQGVIKPGAGTHTYNEGTMVVLDAYPEEGWVFSHWEGPVTEVETPRTMVQAEEDGTITAIFVEEEPDSYQLVMKVAGIGTVFPGKGKHELEAAPGGVPVALGAAPGFGYYFDSWTVDGEVFSTDPDHEFILDGDMVLTANFVSHYAVRVSATEGGTARGGAEGLLPGTQVTVTASPKAGYGFEKWTEGGKTVSVDATYSFDVEGGRSLKAHFLPVYSVNVSSRGGGSVSASLSKAMAGTAVRVTARPNKGYAFLRWMEEGVSLDLDGIDLALQQYSDQVYEFKLDRHRNLVAEFARVYDIDVKVNKKAWGSVKAPAAKILAGSKGMVVATPRPGFGFDRWTENGETVGTFPVFEFTGERDRTLTAHFIPAYKITAKASPARLGAVIGDGEYNKGSTAVLRATPRDELVRFLGWYEDGNRVSDDLKYSFSVNSGRSLTARFAAPVEVQVKASPSKGGSAYAWLNTAGPAEEPNLVPGSGTYRHGSELFMEARPAPGYEFARWLKDGTEVSTDLLYSFGAAKKDAVVTAVYRPVALHQLSVSASSAKGGIVYGGGTFNDGAKVTVIAMAKPGFRFVDWTEDGSSVSSDRRYSFTLTGDRALKANFERTYPVKVSAEPEEGGKAAGTGFYRLGEEITVGAKPSFGYRFDCWTVDGQKVSSDPAYAFDLDGPRELVAHFVEAHWVLVNLVTGLDDPALAGSISGEGFENIYKDVEGVDVLAGAQGFFDEGETVSITAQANDNYKVVKWTDTKTKILGTGDTLELTVEGPTVINLYISPARRVELQVSPEGGGTVTGEGFHLLSNFITVEAQPNEGYRWDRWTENGEYVSGAFRYTFRLLEDRSLVANFIKIWNITTEVYPEGSGNVVGGGTFDEGAEVSLIASHNYGWRFSGWVESPGYIIGTDPILEPFPAMSDRHLIANFQAWPTYEVELSVNETEWGYVTGGGIYEKDEVVTVQAYANYGYRFVNWTEDGVPVSTDARYAFNLEGQRNLVANFEAIPVRTVTVSADPADGGTVTGAGEFLEGETATVTARALGGFSFVNWTVDGEEVSTSTTYSFEVTGDIHVVANFGPWDGVAYDHPTQYLVFKEGYRDPVSTATSITQTANYTRVYASLARAVAEIAWVTDDPVDLSGYSRLYIDWQNSAGASNNNNHAYFGVSVDQNTAAAGLATPRLAKTNRFNRTTESIDISGLTGNYYIRVHARDNDTGRTARTSDIYVYKIWVE
jgi:hypothetical protein